MSHFLNFLGRFLMSSLFLLSFYWHITNWDAALAKTSATGVFRPDLILMVATALLGIGGLSLLLGYKTRLGALLLILEVIMTAMIFHPFWSKVNDEILMTFLQFLNRLALCGGLLILIGIGPGSISLDHHKMR